MQLFGALVSRPGAPAILIKPIAEDATRARECDRRHGPAMGGPWVGHGWDLAVEQNRTGHGFGSRNQVRHERSQLRSARIYNARGGNARPCARIYIHGTAIFMGSPPKRACQQARSQWCNVSRMRSLPTNSLTLPKSRADR
jgi:hypothetical protein